MEQVFFHLRQARQIDVATIEIENFDQSGQYLGAEEIELPTLPEYLHYKSGDEKSVYFNVDGTLD